MESFSRPESEAGEATPGVRVSDVTFAGVSVRVYEPLAGGDARLRRGLVYLHGGGWALGSASEWKRTHTNPLFLPIRRVFGPLLHLPQRKARTTR